MRRDHILTLFSSHVKYNAWRNVDIIVSQKKCRYWLYIFIGCTRACVCGCDGDVICVESFAHIECYSDCSRRKSHFVEPLCYGVI